MGHQGVERVSVPSISRLAWLLVTSLDTDSHRRQATSPWVPRPLFFLSAISPQLNHKPTIAPPPSLFFQKSTQTIDIATSHLRRPVITSSRSRAQARSLTAIAYPQQPPRIATRLHTTYRENERGKGSSFGRVPAGCRHSHSANGQSSRREE